MIILDAIATHYSSEEQFELAISVVSSLLEYRNRERIGIGLCTLGGRTNVIAPTESILERQKMLHHLIDMDVDGVGQLLPKLESASRIFPQGAYFILVSPISGPSVMELMRWADIRGMSPTHVHILNSKGDSSKTGSLY